MSWKVTMEVRFSIVLGIRILVDILKQPKYYLSVINLVLPSTNFYRTINMKKVHAGKKTCKNKDILQTCMNENFLTECFKIRKVKI